MASQTAEVLTGAAVIAVAAGFVWYATQATGALGGTSGYTVTASFPSVEGISVGTDVRLAGVKVGSVTALALDTTTFYADATLAIDNSVVLPSDTTALVSSEGLLGGAFVELQPGGSPDNIEPGGEIEDTQGAVSVITLLMKFVGGDGSGGDAGASGDAGATE